MSSLRIRENDKAASFVISQHNGRRGVVQGLLAAGAELPTGTVLVLSAGQWQPVSESPAAPLPAGVLRQRSSQSPQSRVGVIITGDAEVRGGGLVWPAGMTFARHRDCLLALAQLGIVTRPDGFAAAATWPVPVADIVAGGVASPSDAWRYEARTHMDLVRLAGPLPPASGNDLAVTVTTSTSGAFVAQLRPAGGEFSGDAPHGLNDGFGELRLAHDSPAITVGDVIAAPRFGAVEVVHINGLVATVRATAVPTP